MDVVWARGRVTAAEVIGQLAPEKGWNHRTIRTLLGRLVKKGALASVSNGHRNEYRPRIQRTTCIREQARSFVLRAFGGNATSLVAFFVDHGEIDADGIAELKKLLDRKEKRT